MCVCARAEMYVFKYTYLAAYHVLLITYNSITGVLEAPARVDELLSTRGLNFGFGVRRANPRSPGLSTVKPRLERRQSDQTLDLHPKLSRKLSRCGPPMLSGVQLMSAL